ncbi:helix-turn-helix transcriptional regulator [Microbacterium sp. 22303]|uniref:helix-turn-helix transcriptional regulator n=1 Tax=Microbacterium sp. 22303 TaxID=3453905 RepID=UPI003F873DEA
MADKVLFIREVADRLGRSEAQLRWMITKGTAPKSAMIAGRRCWREFRRREVHRRRIRRCGGAVTMPDTKNALAGQGEGEIGTISQHGAGTILDQDTPESVEEAIEQGWIADRALGFTPIMSFNVARGIAEAEFARSGRRLLMVNRNPGRGPDILYAPDLVRALRYWYAEIPSYADVLPDRPSPAPTVDAERIPCAQFPWCDRHYEGEAEADRLAHSGTIADLKGEHVQTVVSAWFADDEPGSLEFDIAPFSEWSITPGNIEAEIAEAIAHLVSARESMLAVAAGVVS